MKRSFARCLYAFQYGYYAVELTENGCADTSACVAITTVGIIENTFNEEFMLYPNPINGPTQIIAGNKVFLFDYEIIDLHGSTIYKNSSDSGNSYFDMNSYDNGIYILRIKSDNMFNELKIIKQ